MGAELHLQKVRERTEQHEEELKESWVKPGVHLDRLLHRLRLHVQSEFSTRSKEHSRLEGTGSG